MQDLWRLAIRQLGPHFYVPLLGLSFGFAILAAASWRGEHMIIRDTQRNYERIELYVSGALADIRSTLEQIDNGLQRIRRAALENGMIDRDALATALSAESAALSDVGLIGLMAVDRTGQSIVKRQMPLLGKSHVVFVDGLAELETRGEQHAMLGRPLLSVSGVPEVLPILLPLQWSNGNLATALIALITPDRIRSLATIKSLPAAVALRLHDQAFETTLTLRPGSHLAATETDAARLRVHYMREIHGTFEDLSAGGEVLVTFRGLPNFDLVATASLDLAHALADQKRENMTVMIIALAVCLLLQIGTIQLLQYVDALHAAHASLRVAEAEERRRAHELDATLDAMIQGAMVVDPQRRITVCNAVFADLAKLPADWVAEHKPYDTLLDRLLVRGDFGRAHSIDDLPAAISGRRLAGGETRHEVVRTDGIVLDVRTKPLADGGFIVTLTDITEHRRSLQRIRKLAEEDPLTELANRRQFYEQLRTHFNSGCDGDVAAAVLLVDLDRFKQVNDTLGHPIGDRLLQEVAERIRHSARTEDVVARLGGDEFAVFQRGIHSAENAALLGNRLIERVSAPYRIDGHTVEIGASIGIALVPADGGAAEDVMKAADVALYHAKANGRGVAHFFEPRMIDQIEVRRSLEDDLRRAVEERQFEVHYQPIHNLSDSRLVGFEALCRWRHPERGLIPPSDFIPLAEETGLITRVGVQVIDDAVAAVASWPSDLHVAVNLSPVQLKCPGLLPTVLAALSRHGLQGHRLELEITEAVLLREDETIIANLNALDAAGVRLAMDDFGTGYSSLSYLRRFPFKKVKIDRSFVQAIHRNSDCQAIVEASAMLARRLGITATAEGIETAEELDIVRALGCDQAQGFLLGRPTTRDAADLIASGTGRSAAQAS
jgi:diguanylate cyclase (GGDEF)-like protein